MMKVDPSETVITGNWVEDHGRVVADQTCERINVLIQTHLEELGRDLADGMRSIEVQMTDDSGN